MADSDAVPSPVLDARAGPPPQVRLRSAAGAALITATVLASAVGFLDASVVNVAVPAIGRDLRASVAALQWILTGYLVAVAALLLLSGALADRFGRRRVLALGLVVMLLASVLCAFAWSSTVLIGARVVQGVGGALVVPSSLAILNGTLRPPDRPRGIGLWAGLATIPATFGPYVGGWLVETASWRWVFLLNVPLASGALLALVRIPVDRIRGPLLSPDLAGAALAILGLGGIVYALTDAATHGWLTARALLPAVVGLVSLGGLVPVERRASSPMLRLPLFAIRQFTVINVTTVLVYGVLGAASYVTVLQFQLQLGYPPAAAGALLTPWSLVFLLLSPVSGVLVGRLGPRWLMSSGIALFAAGLAWLAGATEGSGYLVSILPGTLLWGVGLGLAVVPLTAAVLGAVGDEDLGEASAINDAAARIGGVIAVAVVPVLVGAVGGRSLAAALSTGYRPAMLTLAGVCATAAVIAAVFVADDRTQGPSLAPPPPHGCAPAISGGKPALIPAEGR